jgi:Reverse transcriptase (RNA-dependent DNA polymerase)
MRQPKGYKTPGKEHQVCCLNHTIYGLKQSGREWYETFTAVMYKFGFTHCETEHAVLHRYAGQDALIVAVDVDDLTMARSSKELIQRFPNELQTTFKIKDLGDLHWLLGLEVKRDCESRTISFSQSAYIERILERFNLQDANPLSTPLDPHHKLSKGPSILSGPRLRPQHPSDPDRLESARSPSHKVFTSKGSSNSSTYRMQTL